MNNPTFQSNASDRNAPARQNDVIGDLLAATPLFVFVSALREILQRPARIRATLRTQPSN